MTTNSSSKQDQNLSEQPVFQNPQEILMNAPVGVFTTTPDGRYLSVNNTLARMHGYDSPRHLMDSITDIGTQIYVDPADRDKLKSLLEKHGMVTNFKCRLRHRSGRPFWVSENIRVLKDNNGKITEYEGFNQDITESKLVEDELQKSQERTLHLNAVLKAYNLVNQIIFNAREIKILLEEICQALISTRGYHAAWIILLDTKQNVTNWAQAGLNDEFPSLLACFQDDKIPLNALKILSLRQMQVITDPENQCRGCPLAASYAGRSSFTVRLEVKDFVLGLFAVSVPKNLAMDSEEQELFKNLAGTIAQSIQRIRLEKISRNQKKRLKDYERIISRVSDGMCIVDTDYRYVVVNDAYVKKYGKPRETIEGSKIEDLVGKDLFESKIRHHLDEALKGQEVSYVDTFPDRQGDTRYAAMNYTRLLTRVDGLPG